MKTLILLTAIPASGKSTWAKNYKETHPNTLIISSDAIRFEVTGSYNDHTQQPKVWQIFEDRIHEYGKIDGVTVILDALNDRNDIRLKYLKCSPEYDKKIMVIFPNKYEDSKRFNDMRKDGTRVPDEALIELVKKFEQPSQEVLDLVDEVIEIKWDK